MKHRHNLISISRMVSFPVGPNLDQRRINHPAGSRRWKNRQAEYVATSAWTQRRSFS